MITLYRTILSPSQNAKYDDLETYLSGCENYVISDFKFVKPALETYIKISMAGYLQDKPYNYLKVQQNGNVYYYFIMRHKWVAENTLGLTLALDTVNTFWSQLTFTKQTHITRKFRDRFVLSANKQTIKPVVDEQPEDISNPTLIRTSVKAIGDEHLWYLVQKTDYDSSKLSENPVTSYLLCDETLTMPYLQPLQVKPSDISGDNQAYVIPKSTERSEIRVVYLDGSTITTQNFFLQSSDTYDYCYWWYNSDTELISLRVHTINHEQREDFKSDKIKWIELVSVGTVYKQVSGWPTEVQDSSSNWSMNDDYTLGSPVVYDSYEGNTGVLSFDTWYKNNKTDGRLIKISCLPYRPFDWTQYTYGVDYIGTVSGIKIINPNIEFKISEITDTIQVPTYDKSVVKLKQQADIKYETKRFNSSFSTIKYVFDNQSLPIKLEDTHGALLDTINVTFDFVYNKELSNSFAFKFNSDIAFRQYGDFSEWLIIDKSLDVPFFTNEYLNYLRYGKAVDERQMRYNVTASVLSGLSTTISGGTGAFSALKLAGTGLAGGVLASSITGAIGLISTVTGIASTIATSRDQINQKIDTYQHQSSNVNGSSDLSVFEAYGQNKLLRIDYNMPEEIKTPVLDYFRKFGYHTDEYAIPNFSTRVYSDFVVCEPVFKASYIDSDFLDDITEKCKAGLRVFHYHDDGIYYDTTFSFENWETSLND